MYSKIYNISLSNAGRNSLILFQTTSATSTITFVNFFVILATGFGALVLTRHFIKKPKVLIALLFIIGLIFLVYNIYQYTMVGVTIESVFNSCTILILYVIYYFVGQDIIKKSKVDIEKKLREENVKLIEAKINLENEMQTVIEELKLTNKGYKNLTSKLNAFDKQVTLINYLLSRGNFDKANDVIKETLVLMFSYIKEKVLEKKIANLCISLLLVTGNKFLVLVNEGLATELKEGIESNFSIEPTKGIAGYCAKYLRNAWIKDVANLDDFYKNFWIDIVDPPVREGFVYCRFIKKGVGNGKSNECVAVINISSSETDMIEKRDLDPILDLFIDRIEALIYLHKLAILKR